MFGIQYPGSRTQNPGSRIQDPGSRIQNPGSRIQDPGSRIWYPGSTIQNPETRTQNGTPCTQHLDSVASHASGNTDLTLKRQALYLPGALIGPGDARIANTSFLMAGVKNSCNRPCTRVEPLCFVFVARQQGHFTCFRVQTRVLTWCSNKARH